MSSYSPLMGWSIANAALMTRRDQEHSDAEEERLCSSLSLSHLQRYPVDPFYGHFRGIDCTFGLDTLYASSRVPFRGIDYTFGLDTLYASSIVRKTPDVPNYSQC